MRELQGSTNVILYQFRIYFKKQVKSYERNFEVMRNWIYRVGAEFLGPILSVWLFDPAFLSILQSLCSVVFITVHPLWSDRIHQIQKWTWMFILKSLATRALRLALRRFTSKPDQVTPMHNLKALLPNSKTICFLIKSSISSMNTLSR